MHRVCVLVVAAVAFHAASAFAQAPAKPPLVFQSQALSSRQRETLTRYAETAARWAMVQRVVSAVTSRNAEPQSAERTVALAEAWDRGEDPDGQLTALLVNDCAQALQAALTANPGFAAASVTDRHGALVCASERTGRYYQGDDEAWRRAFADGAGAIFVSVPRDDATFGEVVHIAVPVRAGGATVGVLTVSRMVGG
jgi:hypothetical protein